MTSKQSIKQMMLAVASTYASASDCELDNAGLYKKMAEAGHISPADIEDRKSVGKSGAGYSFACRRLRWLQQEARRQNLLERDPSRRGVWRLTGEGKKLFVRPEPKRVLLGFSTDLGIALWGAAEDVFANLDEPICLAMTSPPYPLAKARAYGNPKPQDYAAFICRLIEPMLKHMVRGASIILNVSNDVFMENSPARSTCIERMVVALEDSLSLRLVDRVIWANGSKAPGPVQYASIQRTHLNVGFEFCLWFTNDPKALRSDNRRVLSEHTKRHLALLRAGGEDREQRHSDGAYSLRPGKSFANFTAGRIPRNVLRLGHSCQGQKNYKRAARDLGLPVHGAPYPESLVRFFVNLLTEPGDLCVDLCAGSQTLPAVCEELGRPWLSSELAGEYIRGGAERLRSAPGFHLHNDLLDGLRLKFSHPHMDGQQQLDL